MKLYNMNLHDGEFLPLNNDITIETKKGITYNYFKHGKVKQEKGIGETVTYMWFKSTEGHIKLFAIVQLKRGLYVSSFVRRNYTLTDKFYKSYYMMMDIPYIDKEQKYIAAIELLFKYSFVNHQFSKHEQLNLKLTDARTKKKYKEFYKEVKGKDYQHKTVRIHPDLIGKQMLNDKLIIIEIEKTLHNESDFLWKLMRLAGLQNNCSFIFFVFQDNQIEYHLELIYQFEKMTKRKFKKLYYTSISYLLNKGEEAFIHYI